MHGNRDFLVGAGSDARHAACTLLPDPTVLAFAGPALAAHARRRAVPGRHRLPGVPRRRCARRAGSSDFLAQPLAERQAIARGCATQSEAAQAQRARTTPTSTPTRPRQWLQAADAPHDDSRPHPPARRPRLGDGPPAHVLSDWDAAARAAAAEVLRVTRRGRVQRIALVLMFGWLAPAPRPRARFPMPLWQATLRALPVPAPQRPGASGQRCASSPAHSCGARSSTARRASSSPTTMALSPSRRRPCCRCCTWAWTGTTISSASWCTRTKCWRAAPATTSRRGAPLGRGAGRRSHGRRAR